MRPAPKTVYTFGDFRLDPSERLLMRRGEPLPLTPKVFDALVLLVENAGHLVEKDEFMKRLWPETFVGDDTLAQNISLLRKALGGNAAENEWVMTVSRRGYRFAGRVQQSIESLHEAGNSNHATQVPVPLRSGDRELNTSQSQAVSATRPDAQTQLSTPLESTPTRRWSAHLRLIAAAIAIGAVAGVLTFTFLTPRVVPAVVNTTQLTHSGKADPWPRLISDGSRLYFLEREGDHWNLVQTSLAGGETQVVAAPFRNTVLLGISPDHSNFLIASFVYVGEEMPLWTWPVQGGPPMRIGNLTAFDAAWHPNGRQIIYAKSDGVYLADKDGSHAARFAAKSRACCFAWSPDGTAIRFSVFPSGAHGSSLWEIRSDGTNLRPLLPDWSDPPVECCGSWSSDGKYFFFGSSHSGSYDLWGLQEKSGVLRRRQAKPFRLTTGPVSFGGLPLTSTDRQKLYAYGTSYKADLVSYDPRSRQFTAFLPGTRAAESNYSSEGEWLVYATSPDNTIWRAKPDGSQRAPLTANSTIVATHPVWSHDAKQIAFVSHMSDCENKVFVLSPEGGTTRELFPDDCEQFDPAWSPDGKFLAFARAEKLASGKSAPSTIELLDLATNLRSTLSGSQGMRAPSWSPDGRFVAAISEDYHRLALFDASGQTWTELAQGSSIHGFLRWSRDGTFLYYQDLLAPNEAVYRIRMKDHVREEILNFASLIREGASRCAFIDLAPEGSLIVSVLRNHADIYALDLQLR